MVFASSAERKHDLVSVEIIIDGVENKVEKDEMLVVMNVSCRQLRLCMCVYIYGRDRMK